MKRQKLLDSYQIHSIIFCKHCAAERPKCVNLQIWSRIEVGLTHNGIQVYCTRCKLNVANFTATIHDSCFTRNYDENPTPSGKKKAEFGWHKCPRCGLSDRFGWGLFGQEICEVCGWETGVHKDDDKK